LLWTLKIMGSAVPVRLPILPVGRVLMMRDGVNVISPGVDAETSVTGDAEDVAAGPVLPASSSTDKDARAASIVP
jgi:hypothetical protein